MKAHLTKISLALLSTVFLLGCQEQGSGAVGPDGLGPEFTHKGPEHGKPGDDGGDNPGSPFYKYTFAGDITTDPGTAFGIGGTGGNSGDVGLQGRVLSKDEKLVLSIALLAAVDDAPTCFGGTFPLDDFLGVLIPDKQDMDEVEARFLFDAFDKGGNPIRYRLSLDGTVTATTDFDDGIFPPEDGETTTVTFTTFSIGAQRNKEKNGCSRADNLPTTTTVTILGTVDDPHD